MTARVQKHGEIGCEVRKKGPSKTTPKHSLNLCNGYAAGKLGKFTVQKKISILHAATSKAQKTGKRVLREPVGTGRQGGRAGVGAEGPTPRCTFVSRSGRNWQSELKNER